MAQLDGYKTGGTIHIVIITKLVLQQTTSMQIFYLCTDVAKVTLSPVLHVNADDAEAVVHAMILHWISECNLDVMYLLTYGI
jgi:2-oxoglutarate dehydrogenase E1 component